MLVSVKYRPYFSVASKQQTTLAYMPALLQENNDFLPGLGGPMHAVKIAQAVRVSNESNEKCSESLTYLSSVKNPGGCMYAAFGTLLSQPLFWPSS